MKVLAFIGRTGYVRREGERRGRGAGCREVKPSPALRAKVWGRLG